MTRKTATKQKIVAALLEAARLLESKASEVEPGSKFDRVKGQEITLEQMLARGISIKEAIGHLKPSKNPAPDIPKNQVIIDLTGDLHSKSIMRWKDTEGRDQRAYTPKFHERTAAKKWERVKKMDRKMDKAHQKIREVLNNPEASPKARDAACVLSIIAQTGLRPGSQAHLSRTGNRGVSTLSPSHVNVRGKKVKLCFIGKSNKENKAELEDAELALYLKARMKEVGPRSLMFRCGPSDISKALKTCGLEGFTAKDIRTLLATRRGAEAMASLGSPPPPMPKDPKEAKKLVKKRVKEASEAVAEFIGNTAGVAQKNYIAPAVIETWIRSVGGKPSLLEASVEPAFAPTGKELWAAAVQVTLPGADELILEEYA